MSIKFFYDDTAAEEIERMFRYAVATGDQPPIPLWMPREAYLTFLVCCNTAFKLELERSQNEHKRHSNEEAL